ncbi:MAG: acetolactate decarboxylase [Syntrophales bacterium]|nr:acetolactate decarboxylase [Syntrophales bacterium]
MKTIRYLFLLLSAFLVVAVCGCSHLQKDTDALFQTSTIDALLEGVYDGETTCGELRQHGTFGLGTFNALDGEMVVLDGTFYQVKTDGIAYRVGDSTKTPFAVVTFFEPDKTITLEKANGYGQLKKYLDNSLPTKNIFYAIKIEGVFKYIKTRSVPGQTKPYPPLIDAVKNQTIFEFHNVKGTIAGFRCPPYVKGINVPGYHLHFITEDKKAGGHMLECQMQNVNIEIDYTSKFFMVLPEHSEFYKVDLTKEKQTELEKVEK